MALLLCLPLSVVQTPSSQLTASHTHALHPALPQDYELHKNDCRHYINCLVRYTTGQEGAASATLSHQWQRGRQRGAYGLAGAGMVRVAQFFTDMANWGKVQVSQTPSCCCCCCCVTCLGWLAIGGMVCWMSGKWVLGLLRRPPAKPDCCAPSKVSTVCSLLCLLPPTCLQFISNVGMYGMLALSGQKALARLSPMALLPAGAKARLGPAVGRALAGPVRQALVRKPVVVGTAAVATLAASASSQAPMLKDTVTVGARVAVSVRSAAQAALGAAGTVVSRASAATCRTTSQAAVLAGSLAGAATRGAAGLMVGRPPATTALEMGVASSRGAGSPLRASLPSFRALDRSQRLALAITSAAVRR